MSDSEQWVPQTRTNHARPLISPCMGPTAASTASPSASELALKALVQGSQRSQTLLEQLGARLGELHQGVCRVGAEVEGVRTLVESLPPVVVVEKPVIQPHDSQLLVCDTESVVQGLGLVEKRDRKSTRLNSSH